MITLGIETSGRQGSIALLRDGELLGVRDLSRAGRRHARTLLAEAQELLRQSHLPPHDVETIAVSIGPGSFTGLRVGVTCAKTWSYATGCQVVGVETFLAVAARSVATAPVLHVISDAQRGDLFVGRYLRPQDASWQRQGEIGIVDTDQWLSTLSADVAVSGTAVVQFRDKVPSGVALEPDEFCYPRAEEVARIGHCLSEQGRSDDVWQLEPLYLRRSAAEEKAEPGPQANH